MQVSGYLLLGEDRLDGACRSGYLTSVLLLQHPVQGILRKVVRANPREQLAGQVGDRVVEGIVICEVNAFEREDPLVAPKLQETHALLVPVNEEMTYLFGVMPRLMTSCVQLVMEMRFCWILSDLT